METRVQLQIVVHGTIATFEANVVCRTFAPVLQVTKEVIATHV